MKITQEVREYAASEGLKEDRALAVGMSEKAKEFVSAGSEIYHGPRSDGEKGSKGDQE
jgi:phosphomethylpyrimidine synthase